MKKIRLRMFSLLLAAAIVLSLTPAAVVQAQTPEERLIEAEEEMKRLKEEQEKIAKDKADAKNALADLNYHQTTIQEQLDELNADLAETAARLEEVNNQIEDKEEEIAKTSVELTNAREQESAQYEAMKKRFQSMYEDSGSGYLDILMQADGFAEFLNMTEYINMIAKYDNQLLEDYQTICTEIEEKELTLEAEYAELEVLKQQNVYEKERIDGLISETSIRLQYYSEQVSTAKDELSAIEDELNRKNDEMEDQQQDIDQIKREIEMSRRSRESEKRDVSDIVYDENDRYLLANLIYCEAGGEPYEGQVAVGAVVINRVRSSVFPDTVYSVIYQKRQFAPVDDGHLALALAQNRATESCYRAADEAMAGYSNVGDCVYFRTVVPGIDGIIIGNHIFY